MCYTLKQYENRLRKLDDLKAQQKALDDMIKALENDIKEDMGENSQVEGNGFKILFTTYITHRFDSTAFKKEHSKMYEQFQKEVTQTRFTYSFD